jgi:hypothetical protein
MFFLRISFLIILCAILTPGCKKDSSDQQCQKLKDGMAANNTETVKTVITQFINQLPSNSYTQNNLNYLASSLSGQCTISAKVLCFDCILTLPGQSEIRLSFIFSPSLVEKTIDISYSPDNKMKVVNMHE